MLSVDIREMGHKRNLYLLSRKSLCSEFHKARVFIHKGGQSQSHNFLHPFKKSWNVFCFSFEELFSSTLSSTMQQLNDE